MEVGGGSRRPRQEVGEAGESSSNRRKRSRYSPLQALGDDSEPEPVSEAENDGSNGEEEEDEEDDEEEEEEEEEEEQSECETDGYDSDDAVEDQQNEQQGGRGVQDRPPQQREVMQVDSNNDDNRPINCSHTIVHQGSTAPAPVPPPLSSSSCSENLVVKDVTVNSSALDCGICFLPLKPTIFQTGLHCGRSRSALGE
ncbi:hypothetical protein HU200_020488 [Digitaria exilis]|uniref:Uncharacterized protein n=1 Tax=Digitaria exilis TaxID=1010633 RepID=A0A835F230_9POAL|nr:hypothetical protein HU200_020488 [Digitaria exilis]